MGKCWAATTRLLHVDFSFLTSFLLATRRRHTMTTKINFADIIKVIKVYLNFHPDCFPIILSFENHCSVPYQEVMAKTCVDVLGDRLYIPTEASLFGRLPSPQE